MSLKFADKLSDIEYFLGKLFSSGNY